MPNHSILATTGNMTRTMTMYSSKSTQLSRKMWPLVLVWFACLNALVNAIPIMSRARINEDPQTSTNKLSSMRRLFQNGGLVSSPKADYDYLYRQVSKKNNEQALSFEPYLTFKTKPPVELKLPANTKYVLECEVSGTPNPIIYWLRNGNLINQDERLNSEFLVENDRTEYGQLSLSSVKSRLYLDCLTGADTGSKYTCVASTPYEQLYANTKIVVVSGGGEHSPNDLHRMRLAPVNSGNSPLSHHFSKETEYYSNQNAIDLATSAQQLQQQRQQVKSSNVDALDADANKVSNANADFDDQQQRDPLYDSTVAGCVSKKSLGSPARIYFWTQTTLENIGSDVIVYCRVSGYPKPSVTWIQNDDHVIVPDYNKYRVLSTGDLLIRNVTFEDMGTYKCVAQNQHGTDSIDHIFFYPTKPSKNDEQ